MQILTSKKQRFVPKPRLVCVELNPGPGAALRLSEEKRWRVVHLSTEMHLSARAIAKRMEINRSTVDALLKKYHETGAIRDMPGRGRKRKLNEADEQRVIRKAKQDKDAPEIARELRREGGPDVSDRTVERVIRAHKLRYLTKLKVEELSPENKEKRLAYARAMKKHSWKKVLFSDEKTFPLGSMKTHAWQEPGKRKKYPIKRHPPKIHVWAAAGYYMKSKLYFFTQNLNGELYRKIIQSRLRNDRITYAPDCPATLSQRYEFLQDNDPKHKAKKTMDKLEELVGGDIIDHPAQSPDLNIMEDLWSYLDRRVKAGKIKTLRGLQRKLTEEWDKMSWATIRAVTRTMPARLTECENLEGGRTHY